jgi:hypothetical protein
MWQTSDEQIVAQIIKKIPVIYGIWNTNVHYRVHKNPPLIPILSQLNLAHTAPTYMRSVVLIVSLNLHAHLPTKLVSSSFNSKTFSSLHAFSMSRPSHPP